MDFQAAHVADLKLLVVKGPSFEGAFSLVVLGAACPKMVGPGGARKRLPGTSHSAPLSSLRHLQAPECTMWKALAYGRENQFWKTFFIQYLEV